MLSREESKRRARTDFGRHLAELRGQRQLTQADLAEAASVPGSTVSFTESGRRRASDEYLRAVGPHLEVSSEALVAERDELELLFTVLTHSDAAVDRLFEMLAEFGVWGEQFRRRRSATNRAKSSRGSEVEMEIARRARSLTPAQQQRVLGFMAGLRANHES